MFGVQEVTKYEGSTGLSHDTKVCVYRGTTFTFDSDFLPHEIKEFPPYMYYYNNFARRELGKSIGINASVGSRVKVHRYFGHVGMLLYAGMWKFDESSARIVAM